MKTIFVVLSICLLGIADVLSDDFVPLKIDRKLKLEAFDEADEADEALSNSDKAFDEADEALSNSEDAFDESAEVVYDNTRALKLDSAKLTLDLQQDQEGRGLYERAVKYAEPKHAPYMIHKNPAPHNLHKHPHVPHRAQEHGYKRKGYAQDIENED